MSEDLKVLNSMTELGSWKQDLETPNGLVAILSFKIIGFAVDESFKFYDWIR